MMARAPSAVMPRSSDGHGRGVGPEQLLSLASSLSTRDFDVLQSVSDHRFLTSSHIQKLHFYDHASLLSGTRSCRRVLRRLHRDGLLILLPRMIGGLGAGSGASVWHVSGTGKRILSVKDGSGTQLSAARVREPSIRFVAHALAIADARVTLTEATRAGAFGLAKVEIEPNSWRRYLGAFAARETLKPDLAVATTSADGEFEDRWFIEVDLGTEHLPTVLRKCAQYEAYRRTGDEQHRHGVFPVVIWLTNADVRAEKLQRAIRATRSLDRQLYRVTSLPGLVPLIVQGAGGAA